MDDGRWGLKPPSYREIGKRTKSAEENSLGKQPLQWACQKKVAEGLADAQIELGMRSAKMNLPSDR